jgi:hypothetical protein
MITMRLVAGALCVRYFPQRLIAACFTLSLLGLLVTCGRARHVAEGLWAPVPASDAKPHSHAAASDLGLFPDTEIQQMPSDDTTLASLVLLAPAQGLNPQFSSDVSIYRSGIPHKAVSVGLQATPRHPAATLAVNGKTAISGSAISVPLAKGTALAAVEIVVTAPSGREGRTLILIFYSTYIKASNADSSDQFGSSVAVSGNTLVVGAPLEDSGATGVNGVQSSNSKGDSGAAYVFSRAAGVWTQQAYLKAFSSGVGVGLPPVFSDNNKDLFGASVAISGNTLVVGAPGDAASSFQSPVGNGAAYVFERGASGWMKQAYLKSAGPSTQKQSIEFGRSVAISANTIVVGAPREKSQATSLNSSQKQTSAGPVGAAYVFVRKQNAWTEQAHLRAADTTEAGNGYCSLSSSCDFFGGSVAISGDTVIVGMPGEASATIGINGDASENTLPRSGAAYVYERQQGNWVQQAYLKASDPTKDGRFGGGVAIDGDTIAVAARVRYSLAANNSSGAKQGHALAYIFSRIKGQWAQTARLDVQYPFTPLFSWPQVAIFGNRLILGVEEDSSGAIGIDGDENDSSSLWSGAAHVFERQGDQWKKISYLKPTYNSRMSKFGASVAISGETFVVGAPREGLNASGVNASPSDDTLFSSGAVYVFD